MAKRTKDNITLGSGKLYLLQYTDSVPDKATLFVDANRVGYIKGGASIEYTEETYEEKDDLNYVMKIITTDEEAILKCGLLTWNGNTLAQLIDRCTVTEADGLRTAKIGGAGNAQGKYWAVGFHHADSKGGDCWVEIIGRNTSGLSLAFAKDSGTVIEPEFKALPNDSNGTLIIFIEEIGTTTNSTPA